MPRINIEEKFWFDPRFKLLIKKIGSEPTAIGTLILFWRLAQEFWKNEKTLIPDKSFKILEFNDLLIECEFAVKTENGIYAKGSERQFQWYLSGLKQRQSASIKGGLTRSQNAQRDKNGHFLPADIQPTSSRDQPTSRSSSSSSSSSKKKNNILAPKVADELAGWLEEIYEAYPKRRNTKKALGLSRLAKVVRDRTMVDRIKNSISKYSQYLKRTGKNGEFIKQFSTFVNEWQEWEHDDKPKSETFKFVLPGESQVQNDL